MLTRVHITTLTSAMMVAVALIGCSNSSDERNALDALDARDKALEAQRVAEEERNSRADITPAELQALQDQVTALMARADITPADLQALQDQVTAFMARADITPADLQALQDQVTAFMSNNGQLIPTGLERGDPAILVNAIDLVANDQRMDADGEYIASGYRWRHSLAYDGGETLYGYVPANDPTPYVSAWRDEDGQPQFGLDLHNYSAAPVIHDTPTTRVYRSVRTTEDPQTLTGVTQSRSLVGIHGLGTDWRVEHLTADYDGGGILDIRIATDVQTSETTANPFASPDDYTDGIQFDGVLALPSGYDYREVELADGEQIVGSLDDVAGSFSCATGETCYLYDTRASDGYFPWPGSNVIFTPVSGGTPQNLSTDPDQIDSDAFSDYLAFGVWLYIPEDNVNAASYDFGLFSHGRDPFEVSHIAALTGTATYNGGALGAYYVGKGTDTPSAGSFTAKATLTAEFGSSSETGKVSGVLDTFAFDADVSEQFPMTVVLASDTYSSTPARFGFNRGSDHTNIFDTVRTNSSGNQKGPFPGGWIQGQVWPDQPDDWHVLWDAAFYGNGVDETDHPTSVAGVFSAFDQQDATKGLAGAFGAHKVE